MKNNEVASIGRLLSIIHRSIRHYIDNHKYSQNIGVGAHGILLIVNRFPGVNQEFISQRMALHKAGIARTVQHLVDDGFIERKIDPLDGRSYQLFLREKGVAKLPHILEMFHEVDALLCHGFSDKEKEESLRILHLIAKNALKMRWEKGDPIFFEPK